MMLALFVFLGTVFIYFDLSQEDLNLTVGILGQLLKGIITQDTYADEHIPPAGSLILSLISCLTGL